LILLYEVSIWCVALIEKRRAEEDAAREAEDAPDVTPKEPGSD